MLGDFPTAEIGTPEWDAQVAESVRQQFAAQEAQDLAWRRQFAAATLPAAADNAASASSQSNADLFLLAGVGVGIWFLTRPTKRKRGRSRRHT